MYAMTIELLITHIPEMTCRSICSRHDIVDLRASRAHHAHGDCPMFRRFYVRKIFVQKVLCSKGSIFRRSYVQKVLCSEGPIFRYIQKVLYSENSLFYVGKNIHLSISTCKLGLQCKITNHRLSFELIRSEELL